MSPDPRAGRKRDRPLDAIAKLADVSGPLETECRGFGTRGQAAHVGVQAGGEICDVFLQEGENVLGVLPERCDVHGDDVDAVEKVLSEATLADRALQIAVGRANQARLEPNGLLAADTEKDPLLDEAQQFRLNRGGQLGNLIEEENSVARSLRVSLVPDMGRR